MNKFTYMNRALFCLTQGVQITEDELYLASDGLPCMGWHKSTSCFGPWASTETRLKVHHSTLSLTPPGSDLFAAQVKYGVDNWTEFFTCDKNYHKSRYFGELVTPTKIKPSKLCAD